MPLQQDKLTRIIAWVFEDDVEFLAINVNVANEFDVDPVFGYVFGGELCGSPIRNVNETDRFRYLKKIGFQTERGTNLSTYARNADDVLEWGGGGSVTVTDSSGITISPEYTTMTDVTFTDWMYLGVGESPDETAGAQDWYKKYAEQSGSEVLDSDGNVVMAQDLGVPFKTGTSTEHMIIARQFTSGPICVDYNLTPEIIEASLAGTIGAEQTAHTITISWAGWHPTINEGESSVDPATEWEAFAFAVSPEHNSATVQILLRPLES